jgi:hypothetical protein
VEVRFNKVSCLAMEYPQAFADLLVVSLQMAICLWGGGGGGGGFEGVYFLYINTIICHLERNRSKF